MESLKKKKGHSFHLNPVFYLNHPSTDGSKPTTVIYLACDSRGRGSREGQLRPGHEAPTGAGPKVAPGPNVHAGWRQGSPSVRPAPRDCLGLLSAWRLGSRSVTPRHRKQEMPVWGGLSRTWHPWFGHILSSRRGGLTASKGW